MNSLVPINPEVKDLPVIKPAHTSAVRAKAAATNRARAARRREIKIELSKQVEAQRKADAEYAAQAAGPLLAGIDGCDLPLAQRALRAAFKGELGASINGAVGVSLHGLGSSTGRVNRGPDWEAEVNRWAREFVRNWKDAWRAAWEEERAAWEKKRPASPEDGQARFDHAVVVGWLIGWRKLTKIAGVKAAFLFGVELAETGKEIPKGYRVPVNAASSTGMLYGALRKGYEEAKNRQERWG
jgi:hypothetical protein